MTLALSTVLSVAIIVVGWIAACLLFLAALFLNFCREDRSRAEDCRERIVDGLFEREHSGRWSR